MKKTSKAKTRKPATKTVKAAKPAKAAMPSKKAPSVDSGKTKAELLKEIQSLRRRCDLLEQSDAKLKETRRQLSKVKKSEQAARERFRVLVESSEDIIYTLDANKRYTDIFGSWVAGMGPEDFIGRTAEEIFGPGASAPHAKANELALKGKSNVYEWTLNNRGIIRHFQNSVSPIYDREGGKVIGIAGIGRDITELKVAEASLMKLNADLSYSEKFLKSIIDNEPECVKLLDCEGRLIDMNPSGLAMIEVDDIEMVRGKSVYGVVAPEHREAFAELTRNVCHGGRGTMQFRIKGLKGTEGWLETHAVPFFDPKRGENVLLGVTRNITMQKQYEDELKQSLKDKDFLIREVNHRVKNNLAILQSLIRLQSSGVKDPEARGYLDDIESRIRTLSMIHERLYRTHDVQHLEVDDYIPSLARKIYSSLVVDDESINLVIDVEKASLSVDYVIPCGLIINELLVNALKHAFPVNARGRVEVSFKAVAERKYMLRVKDTGVGLPEGFNVESSKGLGMIVVKSLAQQIRGELKCQSGAGAEFAIVFSVPA